MDKTDLVLDYARPLPRRWFAWRPAVLGFVMLGVVVGSLWGLEPSLSAVMALYGDYGRSIPSIACDWLVKHVISKWGIVVLVFVPVLIGFLGAGFNGSSELERKPRPWVRRYLFGCVFFGVGWLLFMVAALVGPVWSYQKWLKELPKEPTDKVTFGMHGVHAILTRDYEKWDKLPSVEDVSFRVQRAEHEEHALAGVGKLHVYSTLYNFSKGTLLYGSDWYVTKIFLENESHNYVYVAQGEGIVEEFNQEQKTITLEPPSFSHGGKKQVLKWDGHIFREIVPAK